MIFCYNRQKNYINANFAFQSHQLQIIIALGDIYLLVNSSKFQLAVEISFSHRWIEFGSFS